MFSIVHSTEKVSSSENRNTESGLWGFIKLRGVSFIASLLLLVYFGYFVLPALNGRFNEDDPMNIYYYWSRGGWEFAKGLVIFFSTYYRPMGGVFFFSLYEIFGLNPFPYHVVMTFLLLLNVILAYRSAALLSESKLIGWFTALLITYHANMWQLVYLPAFIFDVLCFTFFFSATFYYLRIRVTGVVLNKRQTALFLLLYIGALEAKEMAVGLPLMLLLYELIWHWGGHSVQKIRKWISSAALPSLIAGGLTFVYILGKSIGVDALSKIDAYRPRYGWHQYYWTSVRFVNDIFYRQHDSRIGMLVLFPALVILGVVAWRFRNRLLAWAVLFVIITPLPITFIPDRGGAMLYITLFGWALMGASAVIAFCRVFATKIATVRLNPVATEFLLLTLSFIFIWIGTAHFNKSKQYSIKMSGVQTWSIKEQLETILRNVKAGDKIAFMNNPFEGRDWDLLFIAELLCHDHSVKAKMHTMTPLTPEELAATDYIFAVEGKDKLIVLKRPQ